MQRRTFLSILSAAPFAPAFRAYAQKTGEPGYTLIYPAIGKEVEGRAPAVSYPDDTVYALRVQTEPAPNGGQTVRVKSSPSPASKNLAFDTYVSTDADGAVQKGRFAFGPAPFIGILLEVAKLPSSDTYQVYTPEKSGVIPFAGKLIAPMVSQLFVGRQYDWVKGGPQPFAWVYDSPVFSQVFVANATLTALNNGKPEPIELSGGVVQARKLRAEATLPSAPDKAAEKVVRDFWVGPGGEAVRCDNDFFGLPFKADAAPPTEANRRALVFDRPKDIPQIPPIVLRADKRGTGQAARWEVGLDIGEARSAQTVARAVCDANFQLAECETPWRGRKTEIKVVGNQLRWRVEADKGETANAPSGRTFWFPSWFVTALWEGEGMPFGGMEAGGKEKRDGVYFAVTGQRQPDAFTLERLADASATLGGEKVPVRHYRFSTQTITKQKEIYDIYTNGSRLIAALCSNKMSIVRGGWEAWAKAFPFPVVPVDKPADKPAGK